MGASGRSYVIPLFQKKTNVWQSHFLLPSSSSSNGTSSFCSEKHSDLVLKKRALFKFSFNHMEHQKKITR